jgi:hypothetical protein
MMFKVAQVGGGAMGRKDKGGEMGWGLARGTLKTQDGVRNGHVAGLAEVGVSGRGMEGERLVKKLRRKGSGGKWGLGGEAGGWADRR